MKLSTFYLQPINNSVVTKAIKTKRENIWESTDYNKKVVHTMHGIKYGDC